MSSGVTYCVDEEGELVAVPDEQVTFRPAVYGILIDGQRIVLERRAPSSLWRPPGSRMACGETPAQVLQAQFRAATGFAPVRGPLLLLEEQHRVDDQGRAWHLAVMYYALRRPVGGVATMGNDGPQWVPLDELTPEKMLFGYRAVDAARNAGWQSVAQRLRERDLSSSQWN